MLTNLHITNLLLTLSNLFPKLSLTECQAAYEARAVICLQMKNIDASFQDINKALKISNSAELLTNRGVIYQVYILLFTRFIYCYLPGLYIVIYQVYILLFTRFIYCYLPGLYIVIYQVYILLFTRFIYCYLPGLYIVIYQVYILLFTRFIYCYLPGLYIVIYQVYILLFTRFI